MIISLSYLIISFHQKSLQNHKKSTIFDIFHIQKRIHEDNIGEHQPGLVSSYQYVALGMLDFFQNAKTMIFDDFFGFLSVFVIFFKKFDDFRVTTLKYAPKPLFSRFSATRVISYPTNRLIINADRIERPKNRTPCDFGVLSDPHLL